MGGCSTYNLHHPYHQFCVLKQAPPLLQPPPLENKPMSFPPANTANNSTLLELLLLSCDTRNDKRHDIDASQIESLSVLHPEKLRSGMMLIIAVRAPTTSERCPATVIGPFMFLKKLDPLPDGGLPTAGQAQLLVLKASFCWQTCRIIAPKDGDNVIFGKRYSLHTVLPKCLESTRVGVASS